MAKNNTRGGGPGTSDRGGVRTTMSPSFAKDHGKGPQQSMNAPFNAPRAGGDNGLPTRLYDSMGGPGKTPAPSSAFTSPSAQGPTRKGTK
jgi:hypothetical protein